MTARTAVVSACGTSGTSVHLRAEPLRQHIEYAGLIPRIEQLASRFETKICSSSRHVPTRISRAGSTTFLRYARHVRCLTARARQSRVSNFSRRLAAAVQERVFHGGREPTCGARCRREVVESERFLVPEYETTAHDVYPRTSLRKPFAFTIYRFVEAQLILDVSADIATPTIFTSSRFHVKERLGHGDVSFRWTQDLSIC